MKININDTNYAHFKKIFEIVWIHFKKYFPEMPSETDPVNVLRGQEMQSSSMARKGLKMGLMDMLTMSKEFPPELKNKINRELADNNLESLDELNGARQKIISKVLKRGKIKSLDEFYIIKEEVNDMTSDLNDENRSILDKCLVDFEFSKNH